LGKNINIEKERLAAYAHGAWSGWMRYLFGKCEFNKDGSATIPKWAVERWLRQSQAPYKDMPEEEKESDREEAEQMLNLMEPK